MWVVSALLLWAGFASWLLTGWRFTKGWECVAQGTVLCDSNTHRPDFMHLSKCCPKLKEIWIKPNETAFSLRVPWEITRSLEVVTLYIFKVHSWHQFKPQWAPTQVYSDFIPPWIVSPYLVHQDPRASNLRTRREGSSVDSTHTHTHTPSLYPGSSTWVRKKVWWYPPYTHVWSFLGIPFVHDHITKHHTCTVFCLLVQRLLLWLTLRLMILEDWCCLIAFMTKTEIELFVGTFLLHVVVHDFPLALYMQLILTLDMTKTRYMYSAVQNFSNETHNRTASCVNFA